MTINYKSIYKAVIEELELSVGSQLSSTINTLPSIYKARGSDLTKANFPFMTVDIGPTVNANSWITSKTLLANQTTEYAVDKDILVTVTCFANKQESYSICQDAHFAMEFAGVSERLKVTANSTIRSISDIDSLPDVLADRLQESNSFDIVLTVRDIVVDTNSWTVETLTIEGSLEEASGNIAEVDLSVGP